MIDKIRSASGWVDNRLRVESFPTINVADLASPPFYQTLYTCEPGEYLVGWLVKSSSTPDFGGLYIYSDGHLVRDVIVKGDSSATNRMPVELHSGPIIIRYNERQHAVIADGWSPNLTTQPDDGLDSVGDAILVVNPDPEAAIPSLFWHVDSNGAITGSGGAQILTHRIVSQGSYPFFEAGVTRLFIYDDTVAESLAGFTVTAVDGGGNITDYVMDFSGYGFVPGFYTIQEGDTGSITDMVFEVLSVTPAGTEPDWWDPGHLQRAFIYDGGALWYSSDPPASTGGVELLLVFVSSE